MREMLKKASTRQRVPTTVDSPSERSIRRSQDDARAMELLRIFSGSEPVAAQGRLQRRTVRVR